MNFDPLEASLPWLSAGQVSMSPAPEGPGYDASFTWNVAQNFEEAVFHTTNNGSEFDMDSVVESCHGSIMSRPPEPAVPCELQLSSWRCCCFNMVCVVSESKHVEMYVNGAYEATSKGQPVSSSEEAMFQHQFQIDQVAQKITMKFLSLGSKESIRVQAVVVGVTRRSTPQRSSSSSNSSATDISSVRDLIKSMNMEVGCSAEKLMDDIQTQQLNQKQTFQQVLSNGKLNEDNNNAINNGKNTNHIANETNRLPNLMSQFQTMLSSSGNMSALMGGMKLQIPQVLSQYSQQQPPRHVVDHQNGKVDSSVNGNSMSNGHQDNHNGNNCHDSQQHNGIQNNHSLNSSNGGCCAEERDTEKFTNGDTYNRPCCGSCYGKKISDEVSNGLLTMEQNLMSYIDTKMEQLRNHLDKRVDEIIK